MTNKENMSIYKNLTMLSTAKFLSGFAGYVYDVGIVIYLYNMTESVAVIGGFFVSQFLPAFVMLMLGEMIDRYNKKRLMIISGFIKAVICLVLLNNRSVWSIYLTTFLMNLILEFEHSTSSALMVDVFFKEEIFKMASVMNVVDSASLIMGPICASFLAAKFDIGINLVINILLYIISAVIYGFIQMNCMQDIKCTEEKDIKIYRKKGIWRTYIKIFQKERILSTVIFWNIFMLCIGIALPLEITMIEDTLKMSSAWYGIGNMVEGLGMMVASAFILGKIKKLKPENIISLGLFTAALSYLMIGISPNIWMYFIGAGLVGMTSTFCPLGFKTEIQVESSPEIVGRTFTTARFTILISRTVGSLIVGGLLNIFSIRIVYYGLTGILMVSAIIFGVRLRDSAT